MKNRLQKWWYQGSKKVWFLLPLSLLFWSLSGLRRLAFRVGLLRQYKSELPTIIVGNISVGGNGKTPLVIALVEYLQARGYTPAVLSRGYGGTQRVFPHVVTNRCSPSLVGDEPALLLHRLSCLVVIDPNRSRACQYIEAHTQADVLVCDDGLQHYALGRDIELCVLDSRGIGNGYLLPMGPLRESKKRLHTVDATIINGNDAQFTRLSQQLDLPAKGKNFQMQLQARQWVNLKDAKSYSNEEFIALNSLKDAKKVRALAGIGAPQRFFDTLDALGVCYDETIPFDDHHRFVRQDIPMDGVVLMTEKDAVKCRAFAHQNCWYLQVNALIEDGFFTTLKEKL